MSCHSSGLHGAACSTQPWGARTKLRRCSRMGTPLRLSAAHLQLAGRLHGAVCLIEAQHGIVPGQAAVLRQPAAAALLQRLVAGGQRCSR